MNFDEKAKIIVERLINEHHVKPGGYYQSAPDIVSQALKEAFEAGAKETMCEQPCECPSCARARAIIHDT